MPIRFARLLALAGLSAVASLILGAWPPSSEGFIVGRYQVEACTEAVGYANNSWTVSTNNSDLETHTTCGEAPASYQSTTIANLEVADVIGLTTELPVGAEGAWEVKAPAGATIAEVTGYSSLFRNGGDAWQVYRASEATNGEITIEQTCKGVHTDSCGLGGLFQAAGLHARRFAFTARCEAEEYEPGKFFTTCPDGALLHDVRAGINYATVTLEDPNPPTEVTASQIPTGTQHATMNIDGSATDTTAGLLSLSVIDNTGQTVAGPISAGTCDYSKLTPCPTTANLSIPINTESLPDGNDQLRLVATNAAHDESTSQPFAIEVENHPISEEPQGGRSLGEKKTQPKQPGGSSGQPAGGSSEGGKAQTNSGQKSTSSKQLPALVLRLLGLHLHRHTLHLNGTTQSSAQGWLRLTFRFRDPRDHVLSIVRRAAIHHGHLTTRLRLPAYCPRHVELRIQYPGDRHVRATSTHHQLRLPAC
jgi:hypothetical protein